MSDELENIEGHVTDDYRESVPYQVFCSDKTPNTAQYLAQQLSRRDMAPFTEFANDRIPSKWFDDYLLDRDEQTTERFFQALRSKGLAT
ncbi:MAG: hypothetical protein ABEL76_07555 [Bradymonadaceae bacterium]